MKRYLPFVIIGAVAVVVLAIVFGGSRTAAPGPVAPAASSAPANAPVTAADTSHMRGGKMAAVTIEEFGDYQCPPCAKLHPEMKQLEREFGERMRFIFRFFPLTTIHKNAMAASAAAEASSRQGKFWEMHNLLYEKQNEWKDDADPKPRFEGYAKQLGLDTAKFLADLDNPAVLKRIQEDVKWGESLRVGGTPTVFVNGKEIQFELTNLDGLRRIISEEIARKGK